MNVYEHTGNEVDLKAIDSVGDAHVAALNAGDARVWAALFTDDGVQMPPNMPANIGRSAIEPWSTGFMDTFNVEFALFVDEVRVLASGRSRGAHTQSAFIPNRETLPCRMRENISRSTNGIRR